MKYLTNQLHIKAFIGSQYEDSEDKILIGYLNNDGTKLKDVITGQIAEDSGFPQLSALKCFEHNGYGMALGYMTNCSACNASPRQHILAKYIDSAINNDVIGENKIASIKDILNREMVSVHDKEVKERDNLAKHNEKIQQYSIPDEERDF